MTILGPATFAAITGIKVPGVAAYLVVTKTG